VGTVIQDQQQRNPERQPRWDRFERADLFAQYRELRTQGISERQAAKELKVSRTTLQAWRMWHDTLDMCPHVADCFQSGPGLAFLHRLVAYLLAADNVLGPLPSHLYHLTQPFIRPPNRFLTPYPPRLPSH
jgi:hypothetical protein